jgi:hypothetical protein
MEGIMTRSCLLAAGVALALAAPAQAFTPVSDPHADYRTLTTLLGVPASPGARDSWGDVELTVSFSTPLLPLTVGAGWATWGSPPDTEQDNPRVWWTQGATTLELDFSAPVTAWGFEAQPNPFAVFDITADFYDGATLLGSITRSVSGDGGARLFAGIADFGDSFTRVVVSSEADFAIAQLRYVLPNTIIPEPATWAMLIAGFGLVGAAMRRRNRMARLSA